MVKTVLIFIGLKIAEISCAVIVWWLMCHLGVRIDNFLMDGKADIPFWMGGLPTISLVAAIFLACLAIDTFIKANWNKAKELSGRF